MKYQRQRTKPKDITYSLYLYCLILSFRISAKDLHRFVHTNMYQSENGFKNALLHNYEIRFLLTKFTITKRITGIRFPKLKISCIIGNSLNISYGFYGSVFQMI